MLETRERVPATLSRCRFGLGELHAGYSIALTLATNPNLISGPPAGT